MNANVKTYRAIGDEDRKALEHKIDQQLEEIRARAYALFEQRGGEDGHALEDWSAAEREVIGTPQVMETGDAVQIRMAVPEPSAEQLEVTALAEAVMVEGDRLFRCVALPHAIQPERVTARMEQEKLGPVLVIAAPLQFSMSV